MLTLLSKTPASWQSWLVATTPSAYELAKDIILPLTLAALAAFVAWWIFIIETKRDKKKEIKLERQQERDKLSYFSIMIRTIIDDVEYQNNALKEFSDQISIDPLQIPMMTYLSLNNLRRITFDLDLEKYLLAYVSYFDRDRQQAVREFNTMSGSLDVLFEIFKSLPEQLEKSHGYDHSRKEKFQEIQTTAHNLLGPLTIRLQTTAPAVANELGAIGLKFFSAAASPYDLKLYYDLFFVPFNKFATKYVGRGMAEDALIAELATLTRDGKQVYLQIIQENKAIAQNFLDQVNTITDAIADLKEASSRLNENFTN
ncbi:hypothetical protein SAMN04487898_10345 [Pedobacter sp. ok626]|uniref:hypothetical protein n=1 Tax=Pedobacter sp. ok626 TaxID=1761882 RepID=UPI00087E4E17|nr:hypothetical protein [Pedobacter sp. ok626]SDJ48115.1 hypothetical protein SAMN04487898_10345 [Pedobacter sp. ok626]